ncbi:MAG: cation:proton antiporter [Micavibrio aeruginosavorus]|nr:cation:proton antiporter [Micavibrio aeruginosavorus]
MPSEPSSHFPELLVLLGIAGLTVPFLHRFRIPQVLGFLFCGILVGPYGLALWAQDIEWIGAIGIKNTEIVNRVAELGVIFLMFMIGLKLSLNDLWGMRRQIVGLGGCQIVLTALVVFAIARGFGNSVEMSILLGACFALSSTAVVMQIFDEKKKLHSAVGKLSFSILLMQDLAVVPILALLAAFSAPSEQSLAFLMAKSFAVAAVAVATIYFIGMKALEPVLRYLKPERHPEWLMSFVLFLTIGTAMITESFGLSAALGAFLAGLLLAETDYCDDVEVMIAPIKGLLMGVFFLSVGMMIDLRVVLENPVWLFLSVIGIGAIKAGILFALCLAFGQKREVSAETAIMLGQSGEFVFVIAAMAQVYGILQAADAQFFMLVTAISMMMTPFIVPLAPVIAARIAKAGR